MVAGGVSYTYLGYANSEALAGDERTIKKGPFALGLIFVVVFLPRLVWWFRRGPKGLNNDE